MDTRELIERLRGERVLGNDGWIEDQDSMLAADALSSQAAEIERLREALKQSGPPVVARPHDLPEKDWRGWDLCAQAHILAWKTERRAALTPKPNKEA